MVSENEKGLVGTAMPDATVKMLTLLRGDRPHDTPDTEPLTLDQVSPLKDLFKIYFKFPPTLGRCYYVTALWCVAQSGLQRSFII